MINIRHTGIVTNDLKKSLIFWQKIIGFKIVNSLVEKGDLLDKVLGYKTNTPYINIDKYEEYKIKKYKK